VKLVFVPVSVLGGLLAGIAGKKIFERVWSLIDEQDPPDAKDRRVQPVKLVVALALEGAIFRLIKGLFDHGSRLAFARMTGAWPGEEAPERSS